MNADGQDIEITTINSTTGTNDGFVWPFSEELICIGIRSYYH